MRSCTHIWLCQSCSLLSFSFTEFISLFQALSSSKVKTHRQTTGRLIWPHWTWLTSVTFLCCSIVAGWFSVSHSNHLFMFIGEPIEKFCMFGKSKSRPNANKCHLHGNGSGYCVLLCWHGTGLIRAPLLVSGFLPIVSACYLLLLLA